MTGPLLVITPVCDNNQLKLFVMNSRTSLEQLNTAKYIRLREISESDETFNNLSIVVEEAVVNYGGSVHAPTPGLEALLKDAHPIEPVEGCKRFRLFWKQYVAYLVTEELVGSNASQGYDDEQFEGKVFRTYTKSHFLSHVARDTGGHIHEVLHFKLVCLDHLIDIASYHAPEIEVLTDDSTMLRVQ